jgi:hypothetical protein
MIKKTRAIICILGMLLGFVTTVYAEQPTIEEITFDPAVPIIRSTFTLTATITSEDTIESVYVTLSECDESLGICFPDSIQNLSMTHVEGTDTYQVAVTLSHADATYMTYQLSVKHGGTWDTYPESEVDLQEPQTDGTPNGDTNDNGSSGTPGFELVVFLLAIALGMIILKRKRF